ncbi:MAG: lamin tail domain-containing protein [Bacteroidales bacterium]|nr:lamin tail domain-containing protein [Bacteroidales bacterium]
MNFKSTISYLLAGFFLACTGSACAQISDDFSSGSLSGGLPWQGDTQSFTVNGKSQLQLNAAQAGTCYLSVPTRCYPDGMEWEFFIQMNFSPSDNNYCRFYLQADTASLNDTALTGYYLRFGENGSNDAVKLYFQQHNQHTLLAAGNTGSIASAFEMKIKVIYSPASDSLTVLSAPAQSNTWQQELAYTDYSPVNIHYLGMLCTFTVSNASKFFFDDIYHGPLRIDTIPPYIAAHDFQNENGIVALQFSEPVDIESVDTSCFVLDNSLHPVSVELDSEGVSCRLHFNTSLDDNTPYTLYIYHIRDLSGNSICDTLLHLFRYRSRVFDVVINEIMPSPSPSIGLPAVEYIELYNRNRYAVPVNGWRIKTGNTFKYLPDTAIPPLSYALIVAEQNNTLLTPYGLTLPVSGMSINDMEQTLTLYDNRNQVIHHVKYSSAWYGEKANNHGGLSLEMTDAFNPCAEEDNWSLSTHPQGGTPGSKNSISAANPDMVHPYIKHIAVINDTCISVYFSERMSARNITGTNTYHFSRQLQALNIFQDDSLPLSVNIILSASLEYDTEYTLTVSDSLADCAGNLLLLQDSYRFCRAKHAQYGDVVLNEILFNPHYGGVDFVEIYNISDTPVFLHSLKLSTRNKYGQLDSGKIITPQALYLYPKQYMAFSVNGKILEQQYHCPYPENLVTIPAMPAYANENGTVCLLCQGNVIDEFAYDASMHYSMLTSVEGVSLERINPYQATQNKFNWHSAASTVGYATPGYQNSAYSADNDHNSTFHVQPLIFSPDDDAYNDVLEIYYRFDAPGYRVSIDIYNSAGLKIRSLVNNEPADTEGLYTWDGCMEEHVKAAVGNYVIMIKYWNLHGECKKIKKICALAMKK